MKIDNKLEEQMGSEWVRIISKFIESDDMDAIFRELYLN